jgi:phytoene dehydrogenase-like protein
MALTERGSLVAALKAACGAEMRFGATVREILVSRGVAGVTLAEGESIAAPLVLSSLPRYRTEALAGLERPPVLAPVGAAQITLTLSDGFTLPPLLDDARAILAMTPEDYADAHEAARAGKLAAQLPLTLVAEGPRRLLLTAPLAPVSPTQGWAAFQTPFAAAAIKSLRRHLPGLSGALTGVSVTPPRRLARASLAQLVAPAQARAVTRIERLWLCGDEVEPVPCLSGRAGRFAAHFAAKALQ